MANNEANCVLEQVVDGELVTLYPVTKAECVQGLSERIGTEIQPTVQELQTNINTKADSSALSTTDSRVANLQQQVNNIASLPEGSTTGDAELVQARVGVDGTNYTNLKTRLDTEMSDVKEDFSHISESTRNLYHNGDKTFTKNLTVDLKHPISAGTYTVSALVTSNEPTKVTSRLYFYDGNAYVGTADLKRDIRSSQTVEVTNTATKIVLFSGTTNSDSTGYSATFRDIQIENGQNATEYIEPLSAKDDVLREEFKETTSAIKNITEKTRNLYLNGDKSFSKNITIDLGTQLPEGTYTVSAVIDSDEPTKIVSRMYFYDGNEYVGYVDLKRGERDAKTVTTTGNATMIVLFSGTSIADSANFSATFRDIQIEVGEKATPYIAPRSANDSITREELAQIKTLFDSVTEITKNLYSGGDKSFVKTETYELEKPLPAGTYTFSANVSSDDTDSGTCRVQFYDGINNVNTQISRGTRTFATFTIDFTATKMILNASDTPAHATDDTAVFSDIQIEEGTTATAYVLPFTAIDYVARTKSSPVTEKKIVNIIGDSITYGVGASDTAHRYATLLETYSNVAVNNYGLSSSKISEIDTDTRESFVDRIASMDKSADMILMFGGTNDYWHKETTIGDSDSTDKSTLCGALNYIIPYVLTTYPNKEFAIITPYNQYSSSLGGNSDTDFGHGTLKDFVDAIKERANFYSVPVIDLYTVSCMDMAHNTTHRKTFGNSTNDCVHPNDCGHNRIARIISKFINNIVW